MARNHDDPPGPAAEPRRGRFGWIRWALGFALAALLTAEALYLWPTMSSSWRALTDMSWGWVVACVFAQMISLVGFTGMQQRLLRAAGVYVGHLRATSVVYASTAIAVTMPAGTVFSTAFTYRQTRRWGATPVVASWQLAVAGVISTGTLTALGVCGALAVGSSASPLTLALSLAGVTALGYGLRHVVRNPSSIESTGVRVLGVYNRVRKRPDGTGSDALARALAQLEAVELRRRDAAGALAWSGVHRVFDAACLGLACLAVGGQPTAAGLLIAFAAAKAVGSVPLAPAGLGFVDGTLIATLTAAGLSASQSLAAVFVYRVVSVVFVALVGWSTVALLYREVRIGREFEADADGGPAAGTAPRPAAVPEADGGVGSAAPT
ncbi:YbhN family protein [Rhodococcus sp. (in: high G+C Gram-positive bacteria)]|uniref:lysylphosphatidylglycerol synthase transmembrane domain-containing protein n=1 Tax=Rhodococcus sp. TaxID=1831 RepID=UPI00257E268D|nr:YbhN family protein [Rhodococcus sp. (in: high G+C Gram-positive bacteria)]